jgi:TPR repeat protein
MNDNQSISQTGNAGGKELPAGTRLEEFIIERVLGSGGFGITYLARDTSLNRQVVIKENLPSQFAHRDTTSLTVRPGPGREDQENFKWSLENFTREAEMLASLRHPGIVSVLRRFQAFATAYFVMPFVEGVPFDELIEERHHKNNPFSEEELRGMLERVLAALDHLHQRGIYHRDIKPANILVFNDGIPVLIDFGSARQRLGERSMTVVESAGYTPFEQLQSRGNVGPWSDLYALGGTLYKALTGDTPPKANDRAFDDPLVPLVNRQELVGCYSLEFLTSIDKVMAPRFTDRWQNSGEWLVSLNIRANKNDIELGLAAYPEDPMESQVPVSKNRIRFRNMTLWALAACLVVIGLVYFAQHSATKNVANGQEKTVLSSVKRPHKIDRNDEAVLLAIAEGGDAYAQALFGFGLLFSPMEGLNHEARIKRISESLEWLEKSSNQNHPLGIAIRGSAEVHLEKKDSQKYAKQRYEEAVKAGFLIDIKKGDPIWNFFVGVAYSSGWGVEANPEEGVKWYRKAADQKIPVAQNQLGICYDSGTGVAKDPLEAVRWYRAAADQGYARGQCNLGICYDKGTGVAKDSLEAVRWYRAAADQGYAAAQCILGICYDEGTGVIKDPSEAVKWYRAAADQGDSYGQYFLGVCYAYGTGVAKDPLEAVRWYLVAADQGDAEAQCNLGICYANGTGVEKDPLEAVRWYRAAADQGNTMAQFNLGICYTNGTGVEKDPLEAAKWYRAAADQGHARAQCDLGICYANGTGVAKNQFEAAKWYRAAADQGDADAQCNLGIYYANEIRFAKKPSEAAKWFRAAADQGHAKGAM